MWAVSVGRCYPGCGVCREMLSRLWCMQGDVVPVVGVNVMCMQGDVAPGVGVNVMRMQGDVVPGVGVNVMCMQGDVAPGVGVNVMCMQGDVIPVVGGACCSRLSSQEYEREGVSASQSALLGLLDTILSDQAMRDKEKRQRLKDVSTLLLLLQTGTNFSDFVFIAKFYPR